MSEPNTELSRYMNGVFSAPRLSREQEHQMFQSWHQQHDLRSRDLLVRSSLRYPVAIAVKYRRYGFPLADLVAEGNLGLAHALDKFNPSLGNRFVTYAAYWIRAYVLGYVIRSWSMVGAGTGPLRSKLFFKLRRERMRMANLLGDSEQMYEALGQRLSMPPDVISAMLHRLDSRDVSLDAQLRQDEPATLLDTLVAPDGDHEHAIMTRQADGHLRETVHAALASLDPRESYIVKHRLMENEEDQLSLAEIGRRLAISRERARQLETRTKTKLRRRIAQLTQESADDALGLGSAA